MMRKDLTRREQIAFPIDLLILMGMLVLYVLYFVKILDYTAKTFAWCLFLSIFSLLPLENGRLTGMKHFVPLCLEDLFLFFSDRSGFFPDNLFINNEG